MNFLQILKNENSLKGKRIGLAVSGGVDSMVLLDIFNKLKYEYDLNLFVLHYNHKWRKTSANDSDLVKKYCIKNNLRFLYKETKGKVVKNEEEEEIKDILFLNNVSENTN